jgi:hypothetical protein
MNSTQMLFLRLWLVSFGRIPLCSMALKKVLIMILIGDKKDKYVAASNYFDLKEFLKK